MVVRRSDLPLGRDRLNQFLPWLIAFMVYLAILALAGVLVLHAMAGRWDRGLGATLTVQIAPGEDPGRTAADVEKVLRILRGTAGVARAEPIAEARILALLEPWLGKIGASRDLPLPHLIDVTLKPGADLDVDALARRLVAQVPATSVDDHRVWLDRLIRLVRTVEMLAFALLALIGLATVGTVVFTTRTGLAIHREAIEVLHLIGAQDSYVAKQFAGRALALGLRGGLTGLVIAVPTLLGLAALARALEGGLLPTVALGPAGWAALALLPLAVALIAMVTARITVLKTLAGMP